MSEQSRICIPPYLEVPPSYTSNVAPPTKTKKQELPFGELAWEDFERLCLRLAKLESEIEYCQMYGERGENQQGIDLYARKHTSTKYTVYQCKREKNFSPIKIKEAVTKFLEGDWVEQTDVFILCTQESLKGKKRADTFKEQGEILREKGISLLKWDSDELSIKLKDHPKIVDDFFSREWVEAFCGREQAESLDTSRAKLKRNINGLDHNLPSIDSFQGREEEQTKIKHWLSNGRIRLIGITSPGGYGKSTLTAKVYREVSNFDRKLWISFEKAYRFSSFGRWLLEQFGEEIDEKTDNDTLINQLIYCLSKIRCLLVMDNVESLLQDRQWREEAYQSFLLKWLGRENASVLLLTSREQPLNLEQHRIESEWLRLQGLDEEAAIELLRDQGIEGVEIDLKEFVQIADGHPLLLKLAGSWLKDQPIHTPNVTHILTQKDLDLFEQLVGAHRDVETSVGRLLTEGLNRLQPHLKDLWLNLSVYRLPFVLATAQVMSSEPITTKDLRGLVKRSLLEEQSNQGEWQFQFLPLLKTFAHQRAGDQTTAHLQAIDYYSTVAKPGSWETKEDITEHLEIFYHRCSLKQYKLAFDVLWECWNFLNLQGCYTTLLEAFELLAREWEPSEDEKSDFGTVLAALGDAHYNLGQFPQAIKCNEQSIQVAQQIDDQIREAGAFVNLGLIYSGMGQFQKAIELHEQGLKMARRIGHQRYEANALNNLGIVYQSLGQYPKAIHYYQQSLMVKVEINDLQGVTGTLINLGLVHDFIGHHQEAIEFHQQGLNIARQIGDRQHEANALGNLGLAYDSLERYEEAIDYHQQSLTIAQEIGHRSGEASSYSGLGNAYESLGKENLAIKHHQRALTIAQEIGDCELEAGTLVNLGIIYKSSEPRQKAIDYLQQGLEIAEQIQQDRFTANAWFNLGDVFVELDRNSEAIKAYESARKLYQAIGLNAYAQDCDDALQILLSN